MTNNRPTRRKASDTTTPAATPSAPRFTCTKVGEPFKLGNYYCQILLPTEPSDRSINNVTLTIRGRAASANMDDEAANLFISNRRTIPKDLRGKRIAFPESRDSKGCVRYMEFDSTTDSWGMVLQPAEVGWDKSTVIVQTTLAL